MAKFVVHTFGRRVVKPSYFMKWVETQHRAFLDHRRALCNTGAFEIEDAHVAWLKWMQTDLRKYNAVFRVNSEKTREWVVFDCEGDAIRFALAWS